MPESLSAHLNLTVTFALFHPLTLAGGVATAVIVGGVVSLTSAIVSDVPTAPPGTTTSTFGPSRSVTRRLRRIGKPPVPNAVVKCCAPNIRCPFNVIAALVISPVTTRKRYDPDG